MNSLKYKLKYTIKLLTIPILFSIFLIIWFYTTRLIGYEFIINNQSLFMQNTIIGQLENSFYRTISHNSTTHLYNNIMSFILLSIILLFIQKTKYYVAQLIIYIVISTIILTNYPSGAGFSFVTSSLHSTAFLLCLYTLKKINNNSSYFYGILIYLLITITMFRQVIIDISMILGLSNIYGFNITNIIWSELSENYTVISAEVHLIGFITGIIIFMFTIIYNKKISNIYR